MGVCARPRTSLANFRNRVRGENLQVRTLGSFQKTSKSVQILKRLKAVADTDLTCQDEASCFSKLPFPLTDVILEMLPWAELARCGMVSRHFFSSGQRVLAWQKLSMGSLLYANLRRTYINDSIRLKDAAIARFNLGVRARHDRRSRRLTDVFASLILTATGIFFVFLFKHYSPQPSENASHSFGASLHALLLFLLRLVGPGMVLFAVMVIIFADAIPGSHQKRNRVLLLSAGLFLICLDELVHQLFLQHAPRRLYSMPTFPVPLPPSVLDTLATIRHMPSALLQHLTVHKAS